MANPIWQSMKFVIARRELFIRYFILIQYYIFAENFHYAAGCFRGGFECSSTFCSFQENPSFFFYLCWLSLHVKFTTNTHTQTHNHISVVFQNHVSALCNIILFYISLFYIEKKGLQTAILYGGNLSLCGPQNSNKVFLFLLSLAFSFHFLIFIWFYYFHSCEFVLEHIVANKKKSLLPKDIWFNCYVFF